jgi:hypothetical protein
MAQQIGADVRVVEFEYDQPLHDFGRIAEGALLLRVDTRHTRHDTRHTDLINAFMCCVVARSFKPHLITAVQCETPSGTPKQSSAHVIIIITTITVFIPFIPRSCQG